MLSHLLSRGIIRSLAVFGIFATVALVGQTSTAAPAYPPSVETATDLALADATVEPGETTTATATVSSSAGEPQGTVTFRVSGRAPQTVPVVDGHAAWETPADLATDRTYRVTARYNGTDRAQAAEAGGVTSAISLVSGSTEAGFRSSQDVAYLTVATVDDTTEDVDAEELAAAALPGDAAGLPGVGQSTSTHTAAIAGVGLVASGLFSLALYYRRVPR